jgi:hypothetical protein
VASSGARAELAGGLGELVAVDQHARAGLREHGRQLAPVAAPVERHEHRAELGAGEQQVERLDAVHRQQGDAVAADHPVRAQPAGEVVGAAVHLRVAEAFAATSTTATLSGQ